MESEVAIAWSGGLPHGCNRFLAIAWTGELLCFQSKTARQSRQSAMSGLPSLAWQQLQTVVSWLGLRV